MNSIKHNVFQVILAIFITVLINTLLFAALPWLNRVADKERTNKPVNLTLLTPQRPPKAPELEKEKRLRMEELRLTPEPKSQSRSAKQQLNKPKFEFEFGQSGFGDSVAVTTIDPEVFGIDMENFGFSLSQVDKPPSAIRKILPIYPHKAKIQGIRGAKVKIRCLVDKNGMPQKIVAAECYPEDALDIFGPPAIEAVKKWRFRPGEIGGAPVPTRVAFNLIFELDK